MSTLFYPTKKRQRLAEHHAKLGEAKERRQRAKTREEFDQAQAETDRLNKELFDLEQEPETYKCPDCGKEEEWGTHALVVISQILLPTEDHQFEHTQGSSHLHVPMCIDCCERSGFLKIAREVRGKLRGESHADNRSEQHSSHGPTK